MVLVVHFLADEIRIPLANANMLHRYPLCPDVLETYDIPKHERDLEFSDLAITVLIPELLFRPPDPLRSTNSCLEHSATRYS